METIWELTEDGVKANAKLLSTNEFIEAYTTELERIKDNRLDMWLRLVKSLPDVINAFGEEKALPWLAIAFTGGKAF